VRVADAGVIEVDTGVVAPPAPTPTSSLM
jgi:hypothetical protein